MPDRRGTEFENLNRYRSYPFSDDSSMVDDDGVELAADVFVDAMLYPVNTSGNLRMSLLDFSGRKVELSDDDGVVMSGKLVPGSGTVDMMQGVRNAGVMVFGDGFSREIGTMRRRTFSDTAFLSSNAVSPVRYRGVTSIVFADRGMDLSGMDMAWTGRGRMSTKCSVRADGDVDVWFDVRSPLSSESGGSSEGSTGTSDGAVRALVIAARGKTLFKVEKMSSSSAYLWMANDPGDKYSMDRDDVCARAHLADEVMNVRDTCGDEYVPCNPEDDLPSKDVLFKIRGCNASIDTYDLVGYLNPVHITSIPGDSMHGVPSISGDTPLPDLVEQVKALAKTPSQHGYGIEISIPGVADA